MATGEKRRDSLSPTATFALRRQDLVAELIGCEQVKPTDKHMVPVWLFKLKREGAYQSMYQEVQREYRAAKQAWEDSGRTTNRPGYNHYNKQGMIRTGYSPQAAWRWWQDFIKDKQDLERATWAKEILGMEKQSEERKGIDAGTAKLGDWRRDDLPDDIAWVASRKCLMDERQQLEEKPPLTDEDFHDCPSPQARVMLAVAYQNPAKFIGTLMDTMKQQWGKKKVDVAVETKAAVAERVEEKKEVVATPKPLEVSDAAKLVERLLGNKT